MAIFGHSQNLAAALPLIERTRPPLWKAILLSDSDPVPAARCSELGVMLIVRPHPSDPATFDARRLVEYCQAQTWWPYAWAIESPNEAIPEIV